MSWGVWLLLAATLGWSQGLRCHGDSGQVDECRLNAGGFYGRSTSLMYHPLKTPFEKEVCVQSLVTDGQGAWNVRRGCARKSLPSDFTVNGGLCFYNTEALYYGWFVSCVCSQEMCNGPDFASKAMVADRRYTPAPEAPADPAPRPDVAVESAGETGQEAPIEEEEEEMEEAEEDYEEPVPLPEEEASEPGEAEELYGEEPPPEPASDAEPSSDHYYYDYDDKSDPVTGSAAFLLPSLLLTTLCSLWL